MNEDVCVGIVGTGLIGGSLALALKRANHKGKLVAYDPNVSAETLKNRFVDQVGSSLAELVEECDVIVLATPVGVSLALLDEIVSVCSSRTILTDVGSTKQNFVDAARRILERDNRASTLSVVPGHPIAGSDESGADSARENLFQGCVVILTPLPDTDEQAADTVATLWEKAGARVVRMDAAVHDSLFSVSSHLPHAVAYALIDSLINSQHAGDLSEYFAGGLRDFTRIAKSDAVMWRDICLSNRKNLLDAIDLFENSLNSLRTMIAAEDSDALTGFFERSKTYCHYLSGENRSK